VPLDPDTFRSVLGRFASGVTVVTARIDDADCGMTVSSFCSLSLQPPLVLACIDRTAEMHDLLAPDLRIVVNILSAPQEALSRRFSEEHGARRFDGIGFSRDDHGIVVLDGVLAWLQCRIAARYPGGDHTLVVAEVDDATTTDLRPLLYYRGGYAELER
jgi:flavin reductase (DIM6/NTAB) family NADH-FMN oxidoreductase RutF